MSGSDDSGKVEKEEHNNSDVYSDEDEMGPPVTLKQPIDLQLLQEGKETEFEILESEPPEESGHFDPHEVYKYANPQMAEDEEDSTSDAEADEASPFERMAQKMEKVTDDGLVRKMILQPGSGLTVTQKSFVTVHYDAYLEYSDEPFDSTRLRQQPKKFVLGDSGIALGVDLAVATMKVSEHSRFLIHYNYFLGELGCKPRIPERATVMFEITLISSVECAGVAEFYHMSREEKQNAGFSLLRKVVEKEKQQGKSCFKDKNYRKANSHYERGIRFLQDARVANEEEDNARQSILQTMLVNSAICHGFLSQHTRVIRRCHDALEIKPNSLKALFNLGKAYRCLGEWDKSKKWLLKAQRLEPDNSSVRSQLTLLDSKMKQYAMVERERCQKMFASKSTNQSKTEASSKGPEVSQSYKEYVKKILENLQSDTDVTEVPFPEQEMSTSEIDYLTEEIEKMGMSLEKRGEGSNKHVRIVKEVHPSAKD